MADEDAALAETAMALNEDAKAERKAKGDKPAKPKKEPEVSGDDEDFEHPGVEQIEIATENFDPDPSEAVQALTEFTLNTLKQLDQPWQKIPAEQQKDLIAAVQNNAKEVVRVLVEMMASRGQEPVRVLLKKIGVASDGKITISGEAALLGSEDPDKAILMLHHAVNKHVMVTRATVEDYAQGEEPEPDADEPEIDFGADDSED